MTIVTETKTQEYFCLISRGQDRLEAAIYLFFGHPVARQHKLVAYRIESNGFHIVDSLDVRGNQWVRVGVSVAALDAQGWLDSLGPEDRERLQVPYLSSSRLLPEERANSGLDDPPYSVLSDGEPVAFRAESAWLEHGSLRALRINPART